MPEIKACCASGSLHTGTPTGTIETVHGLKSYVANAPNGDPKGIVVIIPDAFGIGLPNNRILADEYAKKGGFKVILPDFMDGLEMPIEMMASFKAMAATGFWNQLWKIYHTIRLMRWFPLFMWKCRNSVAEPKIFDFFKALRENEAAHLPVGTAGFCWGGMYVTRLCWNREKASNGKRLVDVGYVAHPSNLTYPDDIEKLVLPYSCAAAGIDMMMTEDNAAKTKDILTSLTAKHKDEGVEHEFVMYDGVNHGFAVRADEEDKHEAEAGLKAEAQAVSWFSRWFANPPP